MDSTREVNLKLHAEVARRPRPAGGPAVGGGKTPGRKISDASYGVAFSLC